MPDRVPVFIHNPKAASTSIRETFPDVATAGLKKFRHIHQPLSSPHIQDQLARAGGRAWLFGVVRHPLSRFVSAWAYFKEPRKRAVPENYVLEACLQGGGINDFVRMVSLEKISKIVPHFQRQVWFFEPPPSGRKVDQIIRFEALQDGITALCSALGRPPVLLPRLRSSSHKSWDQILSKESLDKLRKFYQPDFSAYRYGNSNP